LKAWFDTIAERPAVQRGVKCWPNAQAAHRRAARDILFGKTQYEKR
jgi:GST-like protein